MIWSKVPVRAWFATLGLGCLGLVAVGMELQTLLRLAPCPLCVFQRLLYIVIGLIGLLGFAWPAGRLLWSVLAGSLGLFGFGVAAYQSWMQAYPHLAPECSFTDPNAIERLVDWLGMEWPSMFLATGFCTSRDWELFGLSMANWSVLFFAGIVGYAALLFVRKNQA
jgi:disulfide bond formation protein DsbB